MDKYLIWRVSSGRGAIRTAATRSPTLDHANMPEQASALTENAGASSSDDVGTFVGCPVPVTDLEKYRLMKNHFVPECNYKFPQDPVTKQSFQHKWLMDNRPWLVYSKLKNGGFCLPCIFFATGYCGQDPGVLVTRPMTNFKKALEQFEQHRRKDYHAGAITQAEQFLSTQDGKQVDIKRSIPLSMAERVSKNRQRILSIVKILMFCGRQNIPIRGHWDNLQDVEANPVQNHGNFWALLQFRIDAGDKELEEHMATAAKNATYTSPAIQSEIMAILGDHIWDQILEKVKQAKMYTIIADEVMDAGN